MQCLEVLAKKKLDHILKFASKQVIAKLCGLLKSKNSDIFMKAAKVLSMFFSSGQFPDVINNAILEGVFPGMLQLLYSALDSDSLGIILFGLSNITGGHHQHVTAFLEEEELVQRVLVLTSSNFGHVKAEASYVINNAIQCSTESTLMKFVTEFSQDLISSLCNILRSEGVIGIDIKKETLVSLEKLMKLDGKNGKFTAESSVKFMVDAAEGFETI